MTHTYIGAQVLGHPDQHMTIMFLGALDRDRIEHIKNIMTFISEQGNGPTTWIAERGHIDMLGPRKTVPSIIVKPCNCIRRYLTVLASNGIESTSRWPWNPHIALKMKKDEDFVIPSTYRFSSVYLSVGKERTHFH